LINQLTKPEIQEFIEGHLYDDPSSLMLKANHYPDWPMKLIVEQIQAKRKAKSKLPSWFKTRGLIYPLVLSMEQCSSENTARYKMSLINAGLQMIDLTGGFGVDFAFLSEKFSKAHYVERQAELVEHAQYNFNLLGLTGFEAHHGQSEEFLTSQDNFDLIYLDPARRDDHNEKVVRLEDCDPNVISLLPKLLSKAKQVMLKTSPLLDIKGAIQQLGSVAQVHVIAVANEVKELVFLLDKNADRTPQIHCVNLKGDNKEVFEFTFDAEERATSSFDQVEAYLYEPNASILKAGAFKAIGNAFGLQKLEANTHLYTSSELVEGFPGRTFRVLDKISLNKKALKHHFPEMKANITVRNFPMTVAQIRKKSGLKEGGDQYLFGATDQSGKQLVLCEKIDARQHQ
jgi:16S rRNA G966 N2-methylase RsmD